MEVEDLSETGSEAEILSCDEESIHIVDN